MTPERYRQVGDLYHAALEVDASERAAFLERACAGDDDLRHEVESLIASHEQATQFIAAPALAVAAGQLAGEHADSFAGRTFAHYRVLELLSAGGMGRVYLAEDTALGRRVALKVLPEYFTHDQNKIQRFRQEARAASALNHPNILTVHEVGQVDGTEFIATEYVDGETLREHMARARMTVGEVLDVAVPVASALHAAHESGIVHRDIKAENIMLRRDGIAKVLDFGLAKLATVSGEGQPQSMVETIPGVIMGTAAYMSPEQARALEMDARTDIWSFGVVLYETLAGRLPFAGATRSDIVAAILQTEPAPLARHAPNAPDELQRIVRKCLEKNREQRYQTSKELLDDLRRLQRTVEAGGEARRSPRRKLLALGVIALIVIAAAAVIAYRSRTPVIAVKVPRVQRLTDLPGIEEFPAISPDGRSIVFTASVNGRRQIFVRLIAGSMPVQITRDDVDHQLPRWSPDGDSLVYFTPRRPEEVEGEIWSIPALGGSPRRIIDSIGGADVGRDGRLAFFRLAAGHVQLVTAAPSGSGVRVVAGSVPGYHLYPRWSPDGRSIAFQRGDGMRYDIFVIGRGGGELRQLTHDRNIIKGLTWLPDSHGIVYASSRETTVPYLPPLALWQVPVDGGDPRQLTPADVWYEQPDAHRSGIVSAARVRMRFDLWSFPFESDPAENVKRASQLTRQTGQVLTPTAAPDGDHIAFLSDSGGHGNVWVTSVRTGEQRQITFEDNARVAVGLPLWSPDGRSIAFVSSKGRIGYDFGIWLVDADGRNLRNVAPKGLGIAWSPDGQWIYYAETSAGVIDKIRASGGNPIRVRADGARNVIGVRGATLYYVVQHVLLDGRPELEIRAATPENGPSRLLATIAASRVPSWQIVNPALSPDGEWLAMPLTDRFTTNLWALSTRTGAWRQVTDFGDRATFIARRVSWSSDGRSILAAVGEGDADIVVFEGLIAKQ